MIEFLYDHVSKPVDPSELVATVASRHRDPGVTELFSLLEYLAREKASGPART